LFTPVKVGPTLIPNRFMRSGTFMHGCDSKGFPKQPLLDYYVSLARGKVGLITTGYMYPLEAGKAMYGQAGMFTDKHAEAWQSTVKEVQNNGSKIMFQVADGGTNAAPLLHFGRARGCTGKFPFTRTMTEEEIKDVIKAFKEAAIRIEGIGADGIQIHAAHSYLLSTFLSREKNKRKDKYGGSHNNRIRILQEVVDAVKSVTSSNFLVSVKINGFDLSPKGVEPEECAATVNKIKGVDFFEISSDYAIQINRTITRLLHLPYSEKYNYPAAKIIKELAPSKKLAVVGGWRKFKDMEKAVKDGTAELISLSRPLIREPNLVQMMMNGRKTSRCCSCGDCFLTMSFGQVHCSKAKKSTERIITERK
jgi:2,4-dienoyl-CoA reductase-like NADH-dependent reductase (Old Yellow Enzyme family)